VDGDAVRFAGDYVKSGKPVSAICHAAYLLITLLNVGRTQNHWMEIKPL
jgi:putative intracellular protease/amidase